jgi:uncharacterized protein (TIGR01370 family)
MRLFLLLFIPIALFATDGRLPWVVYYNNLAGPEAFDPYNPVVLDSEHHPDIKPLLAQHKEVLGYVSLGEMNEKSVWFSAVKKKGLLIKENMQWTTDWSVDIRHPYWKEVIIKKMIPAICAQGFNGIFCDQIDVAIALEKEDPKKYRGMQEAAVDLIKTIRKKFPGKRIMLNRGYELIERVGSEIDYLLCETLYTSYNFETKEYYVRPKPEYEWQLSQLNAARAKFPHLVIFSLDYWDPNDQAMIKKIYSVERGSCVRPYVSTIELNEIIPEPE